MNGLLFQVCFAAFIGVPPLLLALRFLRPRTMSWWLVAAFIAVLGWISANGAVHFYFNHLKELLALHSDDSALANELAKGGAKQDSALLLGWLYALVYALPWLAIYALGDLIRKQLRVISN